MSEVQDVIQMDTPMFRYDENKSYILLGNTEILSVASSIYRKEANANVLKLILASLNNNPFLRQAVVSMFFGNSERIFIDPTAGESEIVRFPLPAPMDVAQ